ncbi:MAG: S8 family peptidase, partial [Lachnospiraceae bacterium]|nr:S8 family peptidase [Lachnospiraceae bacterium]
LKPAKQNIKDYYLIPPEAICYSESDIITAVRYVQNYYQVFERPLIICFGLGSSMGDHAGNTYFSRYVDRVARRRNIGVVICGGNEGNSAGHFAGEVESSGGDSFQDVEIKVGENEYGFCAFLWGENPNIFTVEIRSPDGEVIPRINYRIGQINTYRFLYSSTVVDVEYVLVEQASGQQLIFFRFDKPLSGIWTIRVYAQTDNSEATFNMWLPIESFLRSDTYFLRPDPNTTLTAVSYAQGPMTVSTYDSSNNSFYLRSGRGFGRTGEIVPDLAAPGVDISTVLGRDSGSSLAAALAAGAMAGFFQWAVIEGNDITVNSVTANNYFIRGAMRDRDVSYPSRRWGYGRLDLAGVFAALLS